jgi:Zinc carboxypeptidase
MKRIAVSLLLFSCLLLRAAPSRGEKIVGLESLFRPGPGALLQDRNGDGLVDFVNVRIDIGARPSAALVAAASDVAARLGFETMSMDLPLRPSDGAIEIVVGAPVERATGLSAGEGLLTLSPDGRGVLVAGADDPGTRAAADYLAGRAPHLWTLDGPTFENFLDDLSNLLGFLPRSAHVVEVRATRERMTRLTIALELGSLGELARARTTLARGLALDGVEAVVARLSAEGRRVEVTVPSRPGPVRPGPIPPRPGASAKADLDLSNLFTPDGLLGDSDQNLIADRIDALLSPAEAYEHTLDLAARLGLEAAGIEIPLVALPSEITDASEEPTLVLIGAHPLAPKPPELAPGEGEIRVLPEAFGTKSAVSISGGDDSGVERALEQVAVRFPHLWERGKDRTTLDDVEMDLWKFFSGRSPAGQAATALYKLDRVVAGLAGKAVKKATVTVSIEKPEPGFDALVRERVASLGADTVEVILDDRDVQNAGTIFEEHFDVPSEVDQFWRLFRERVLPRARRRRAVVVEARLSEPRDVRRTIERRVQAELEQKGARDSRVRVLSAYKPGYSWLEEVVLPALSHSGKPVASVTLRFARYAPPLEWPQQAMGTPVRWLHEAFPIDEVLARELALPLDRIRFEMAPADAPPYEVVARAADGSELFRETFSPQLVLRPYLDRFRDYEMVNVSTGWMRALSGDEVLVDQRIATDAESFWDHYQRETLEKIYDYVMKLHEGNPRGGGKDAPYFGELEVNLELSEPNETLGLEREILSPMDALHEDLYFTTLMFFRILGRNARGDELTYPGRVLPVMIPNNDGKPGTASIRFTGFRTSRPAVVVDYETAEGETGRTRLDVPRVEMDRPKAMAARVRAGADGLEKLEVHVKVDTDRDERGELVRRERAEDVDDQILSADQALATIENLNRLRERGLYRGALAYHGLSELQVVASWEYHETPETRRAATLRDNGAPVPFPNVDRYLERAPESPSRDLVQWDAPIPPPEAYAILARMSNLEGASVYKVGESYLGREVWAMDLTAPVEASHVSRYKETTLKPTIIYSARQHANEVSSTSHVLKLAEELLTDPEERKKLDRVNVVIHPITNPDGAQLAYDLYRRTPDFLLHAGYLASLGMDVTSDSDKPMPIFPEAAIRPKLWNSWLPDIFLNPHGYPSHQLVQLFSEYTGLVRRGRVTERNWSMNKGWFMPGFDYLDDPRFPRHKEAAFRIRDYITKAINANPDVYAMNQRNYQRYDRYGGRFDDDAFKLPMVDDVMIHTAIKGDRAPGPGSNRGYNPRVTVWSGTTEAPDETASGDWLKLVATAGLSWDRAILQYLLDGDHEVERKGTTFFGGVSWTLDRPRPPKAKEVPPPPPPK